MAEGEKIRGEENFNAGLLNNNGVKSFLKEQSNFHASMFSRDFDKMFIIHKYNGKTKIDEISREFAKL